MAVSLGRKIRRIGLMPPGKEQDPEMTAERREEIKQELRKAAKAKRK